MSEVAILHATNKNDLVSDGAAIARDRTKRLRAVSALGSYRRLSAIIDH